MDTQVAIIGAGITGLSAAIELQSAGIDFKILEAENEVGGRVRSKNIDGYILDRGFQVILTAYPQAKKLLNYEELNLQHFDPGALILKNQGKHEKIGDPLRKLDYMFPTLFSGVGSWRDKLNMLRLSRAMKAKDISSIFQESEQSTLRFLEDFGFSKEIIQQFFKPFFGGIFLEKELQSSSRMFSFVFKMFSEGVAALPQKGMQEIPRQLWHRVGTDSVLFNHRVAKIDGQHIHSKERDTIRAEHILWTTPPNAFISGSSIDIKSTFVSTTHVHFLAEESIYKEPLIALNPAKGQWINNLCQINNISDAYSNGKQLISMSLIGDKTPDNLENTLKKEATSWFSSAENWELLDVQKIEYALPTQSKVSYHPTIHRKDNMWFTGDYMTNGSLNASMLNGQKLASKIMDSIKS